MPVADAVAPARPEQQAPANQALFRAIRTSRLRRTIGLVILIVVLAMVVILSLALGARDIAPATVINALFGRRPDADYDTIVILSERMPRTILGLVVGVCLGASGVIMQGVTRNPLVDGGILGIELGAACAVVLAIVVFGVTGASGYFWFALGGAAVTTAVVYLISRLTVATSTAVSLVISGAVVAAMLAAVINLLIIRDESVFSRYRFWSVGQLAGRSETITELWPFALVGILLALLCGGALNALSLGEDTAAGLGVRVRHAQLGTTVVAVLLCAAATAAAGPIGFVGLVGAHLARLIVGANHRWLIPYGMLCGAILLLGADVAGRMVPGNGEIAVGIMTAVVGTPFFVLLARTRKLVEA